MKVVLTICCLTLIACNGNKTFPIKDHSELKQELVENYNHNTSLFQKVSLTVSNFKTIRGINFEKERESKHKIEIYCAPLDINSTGTTINVKSLASSKLDQILEEENITLQELNDLKADLDQLNCNSFYSFEELNIATNEKYIQTILRYNAWNGINYYYYKIYNRRIPSNMLNYYESNLTNLNEGVRRPKGGIIDSNAIWYVNF